MSQKQPTFIEKILFIAVFLTLGFAAFIAFTKMQVTKGGYVFYQLEKIVDSANKVRGTTDVKMNDQTIKQLKDKFYDNVTFFDITKDYDLNVVNNKLVLTANTPDFYIERMNETYHNQLSGLSNKFIFTSNCEKEICSFKITEK